jgi:hypothetical protein
MNRVTISATVSLPVAFGFGPGHVVSISTASLPRPPSGHELAQPDGRYPVLTADPYD